MKYQYIYLVDGKTAENLFEEENLLAAMEVRGHEFEGFNDNPHLRAELLGQPFFSGVLGPIWGGEGVVRYESAKVYQTLSN